MGSVFHKLRTNFERRYKLKNTSVMDKDYLLDLMVSVRERNVDVTTAVEEIVAMAKKPDASENTLPIQNVTKCPLCGGETTFEDNSKCMTADCPNCIF